MPSYLIALAVGECCFRRAVSVVSRVPLSFPSPRCSGEARHQPSVRCVEREGGDGSVFLRCIGHSMLSVVGQTVDAAAYEFAETEKFLQVCVVLFPHGLAVERSVYPPPMPSRGDSLSLRLTDRREHLRPVRLGQVSAMLPLDYLLVLVVFTVGVGCLHCWCLVFL